MDERFPRPPTERETTVLEFLLSAEFPGRAELVTQARSVEVVGRWDDEPTIELRVAAAEPRLAEVENVPPVEASTRDGLFSVLLFVRDGLLDMIELVDNAGEGMLSELPAPSELADPTALGPTAARSWGRQEDRPQGVERQSDSSS
jgi:hypothetical protein